MRPLSTIVIAIGLLACVACDDKPKTSGAIDADKPKSLHPAWVPELDPEHAGGVPTIDLKDPPPDPETTAAGPAGAASADGGAKTAAAKGDASAPIAAAGGDPVKVLEPGAEPRKKLRYKFKVGQSETMVMDLKTAGSVETGATKQPENALPTVRLEFALEPKKVSPQGDLDYDFRLTSADVVAEAGTRPEVLNGMRKALEPLKGISGHALVTARGETKDATFQLQRRPQNQLAEQVLQQANQAIKQLVPVFPEEAIGKGAKWERTVKVDAQEAKVTQKDTFTLRDITGEKGSLENVYIQTAPGGQPMETEQGVMVRLESMNTNGKEIYTFDLARLVVTSELHATSTMVIVAEAQGQTQKQKVTMKTDVKVAKKP